jgi:single-strand DNA-binding protein
MNKIILMGRLVRDPEIRYTQGDSPIAICKYSLAVQRRFKREGEADVDFINCVVFARGAEFSSKYFKKGLRVCISGRLQVRSYITQDGQKRWIHEVVVEEQDFADSKNSSESINNSNESKIDDNDDDFSDLLDNLDGEDIPF